MPFEQFQIVVLEHDVPDCRLTSGDLGVVVFVDDPESLYIEFPGAGAGSEELTLPESSVRLASDADLCGARAAGVIARRHEIEADLTDPDLNLITDYCSFQLSPQAAAEVRRRLLEDDAFRMRCAFDMLLVTTPPGIIDGLEWENPDRMYVREDTVIAEFEKLESRPEARWDRDLVMLREWFENAMQPGDDHERILHRLIHDPEFSRLAMPAMIAVIEARYQRRRETRNT